MPVEPGSEELKNAFKSIPNLVGIELLSDKQKSSISPQSILRLENRFGLNTVIVDADGKVRRGLLYAHIDKKPFQSFALK